MQDMNEAPDNPRPRLDPRIGRKLGRLRALLRRRLLGEGLGTVILVLLGVCVATLLVDYGLYLAAHRQLTVGQRLLLVLAGLAVLLWATWRRLIRPQLLRLADDDLALVVERANPALDDRLISALQLGRIDDPRAIGASSALVGKVEQEANEMASPLRFGDPIRSDRMIRRLGIALGAALLLGALGVARADVFMAWLQRNVLLRDVGWPRQTHLTVEKGNKFRVGRGRPLDVVVVADRDKVVPPSVTFHIQFGNAPGVEETVSAVPGSPHRFLKHFPMVSEPFTFYVTGNDDRTDPCEVDVAPPPQMREVTFTIHPPEYTHLKPQAISSAQGTIQIPVESTIAISGIATKDLARASMVLDGAPIGQCEIKHVADGTASPRPRNVVGQFKIPTPRPFRPAVSLRFDLLDVDGFASEGEAGRQGTQYTLILVQDKAPAIQMAAVGVAGHVTVQAMIPLDLSAKDDYGIQKIDLEWVLTSAEQKRTRIGVIGYDPDQKEPATHRHVFDLARLAPPTTGPTLAASPIAVGESIRLVGVACDTLPQPDGPNLTPSNAITLRIATDEEVMAALVQSQLAMREQFNQAIQSQSEAKGRTDTGIERAKASDGLGDAAQYANESADQQQQINDRVTAVAARFDEILQQMNNNRVGSEPEKQRLANRIITPLRELTAGPMRQAAFDLLSARNITDAKKMLDELRRISAVQQDVRDTLERVRAEMIKTENAQVVEYGLKEILRRSEAIRNLTSSERKLSTRPATEPTTGNGGK
jgi:hypothetical protein